MSRWWWRTGASTLVFALACSGTSTLDHEQLASARKRVRSLDVEQSLLEQVFGTKHATRTFARAHVVYLQRTAHELVQKLATARPAPGAEEEFQRVRADATRLEERFVALQLRMQ